MLVNRSRVLGVAHVLTPPIGSVGGALGHGHMGHELIGSGTVPVLLARGRVHDVAGADLVHSVTPALDPPGPLGDIEGLTQPVGVPRGARPRGEVDCADLNS